MQLINQILAVCGGISIIGGAVAVVFGWLKPALKLGDRVNKLEENGKKDYKRYQKLEETQALLCQGMIALIDNQITGNNIEGLKKTKEAMIKHLSE